MRLNSLPMRDSLATTLGLLLFGALASCAIIPSNLQLVSSSADAIKITRNADCTQPPVATHPASQTTAALNPHHIALLDWNVYKGQRANWQQDFHTLLQGQDLILLQEALLSDTLQSSLDKHHLLWTLNQAFTYGDHETGVLTASRVSPLSSCGLRSTEPLIRTPKTALVQTYRIAGTTNPLLVANIHAINFSLGIEAYAKQISSLQTILARHDGPLILAGDFNDWSDARAAVVQAMVTHLHLVALPTQPDNTTQVFGHTIDHIYYHGLEAQTHHALAVSSSDHNPLLVVFRVMTIPPLPVPSAKL